MIRITLRYLSTIFALLIVGVSLSSCASSTSSMQSAQRQSLYDRVIQSGKIRCGYVVYSPGCVKNPNTGKLAGIGIEALELVAKKLGLTVEWSEEVGWGTMLEGLETRRYDIVAVPVWTNPNRAKLAAFSKPLYYSPVFPYGRKGDDRFNGHLEKINSPTIKIATIDGETGQVIADADFPKSSRLSMTQMTDVSQLFLSVANKKADIAFGEPIAVDQYVRNNPGSVENVSPNKPVRLFPNCWMFNRDELEFKAMLDTVLDEVINSGAMDRIIAKYEPTPNLIYRVALPYALPK